MVKKTFTVNNMQNFSNFKRLALAVFLGFSAIAGSWGYPFRPKTDSTDFKWQSNDKWLYFDNRSVIGSNTWRNAGDYPEKNQSDSVYFPGDKATNVTFDYNLPSHGHTVDNVYFNTNYRDTYVGSNTITLDTSDYPGASQSGPYTVTVVNSYLGSADAEGNVVITGGGSFVTSTLTYPDSGSHNIVIGSGTTLKISGSLTGTGTLNISGSGTIDLSGCDLSGIDSSKINIADTVTVTPAPAITATNPKNFTSGSSPYGLDGSYLKFTITFDQATSNQNVFELAVTKTDSNSLNNYYISDSDGGTPELVTGTKFDITIPSGTTTHEVYVSAVCGGPVANSEGFNAVLTNKLIPLNKKTVTVKRDTDAASWTGSTGTDWNNINNWEGLISLYDLKNASTITVADTVTNPPVSSLPIESPLAQFNLGAGKSLTASGTVKFKEIITAGNASITAAGITTTDSIVTGGNSRITSTGKLTCQDITFGSSSTAVLTGGTSITGNFTSGSDTSVTFGGTCEIAGSVSLTGPVTLNDGAALSSTGTGTITFDEDLTFSSAASITAKNRAIVFNKDIVTATNGSLTVNAGTSTITAKGNIAGSNTFKSSFIVSGTGTSKFSGNNTFTDFSCTTAGKTLEFKKGSAQTVSGDFNVQDITIKSDSAAATAAADQWYLNIGANKGTAANVTVTNSNASSKISCSGNCINGGNNINWYMPGKYTWNGSVSTDWNNPANWTVTQGPAGSYPGITEDDEVTIVTAPKSCIYNLSQAVTIKDLTVGTAGDTTAQLTIPSTYNLSISSSNANYGKIIYSNSGRLTDTATPTANFINDTANDGTVQYDTGSDTVTAFGNPGYANLIINCTVTDFSDDIFVNNGFTITASGSVTADKKLTVDGQAVLNGNLKCPSVTFNDEVHINGITIESTSSTKANVFAKEVHLTAAGSSIKAADTALNFQEGISASGSDYSLTLNSGTADTIINSKAGTSAQPLGDLTVTAGILHFSDGDNSNPSGTDLYCGDLNATARVRFVGDANTKKITVAANYTTRIHKSITASGDITFGSRVTLYDNATIDTSASNKNITVNGVISTNDAGNTDLTIKAGTGTFHVTGSIGVNSAGTAKKELGALTVNAGSFTVDSNDIYCTSVTASSNISAKNITASTGAITLTGTTVNISGNIKANTDLAINGTNAAVTGKVTAVTGNIEFNSTASTTLTDAVLAGDSITINSPATAASSITAAENITLKNSLTTNYNNTTDDTINCKNLTLASGSTLTSGIAGQIYRITESWKNQNAANAFSYTTTHKLFISGDITGNNTFHSLTLENSQTSNITGSNTFNDFTCITSGKTLIFTKGTTQTVNGSETTVFTVKDVIIKSDSATISSAADQWTLSIDGTKASAINVNVTNSKATSKINCTGTNTYGGNNINWVMSCSYTWTGLSASDPEKWDEPDNWVVTGTSHKALWPGMFEEDEAVIITKTNQPVFSMTGDVLIENLSVGTSSDTTATLTISDTGNLKISGTNKNYATVIYSSTGRLTDNSATSVPVNDTANNGTVQYDAGSTAITDFGTAEDYANLIINSASITALDGDIKIGKTFTINAAGSVTTQGSNKSITAVGNTKLDGSLTCDNIEITTGSLTVNKALNAKDITVTTGTVTINDNISSTGIQHYKGNSVITKNDVTVSAADKNITFDKKLTSSPANCKVTFSLGTGNLTLTSGAGTTASPLGETKVTAAKMSSSADTICSAFTADCNLDTGTIQTTTGDINFRGTTATITGNITSTSGNITISADTTVSGQTTTTGDITLNKPLTTNNTSTINDTLICKNLTLASGGSLVSGKAGQIYRITGNWTNQNASNAFTYTSTHKTYISGNISGPNTFEEVFLYGDIKGNSSISNTFHILRLYGGNTQTIEQDNVITYAFIIENKTAGSTVKFGAGTTQKVEQRFRSKNVILQSSATGTQWTIECTGTPDPADASFPNGHWTADNVKVQDGVSTWEFVNCINGCIDNGNNINWAIKAEYVWKGTASTDWQDSSNWTVSGQSTHSWPGRMHTGDTAVIPFDKSGSFWPVYAGNTGTGLTPATGTKHLLITKLSVTGSGTSKAQLTLQTANIGLIDNTNPLSNSGNIIFTENSGRITSNDASSTPINDTENNGVITYTSNATAVTDYSTGNDYANLVVDNTITSFQNNIKVKNDFTTNASKSVNITSGTYTLTVTGKSVINGPVTSSGSLIFNGLSTINAGITTTGTATQYYAGTITASDVTLTTAQSSNITITAATVTASKLTVTNGTLIIPQTCILTCTDGFTHTGSSTNQEFGLLESHTVTIKTVNKPVSLGDAGSTATTLLKGSLVIDTGTGGGDLLFSQQIQTAAHKKQNLTITAGTGNIDINTDWGFAGTSGQNDYKYLNKIVINSSKNFTLENSKSIYCYSINIKNDNGLFLTKPGSQIIATDGFSKNGNSQSQLAGTINTKNASQSFINDVFLYDTATLSAGTQTGSGSINIKPDNAGLVISASGKTVRIITASGLKIEGASAAVSNFVLFNGNVQLNSNLSTTGDIILLNGTVSTMYKIPGTSFSQTDDTKGLGYHNALRTAASNLCPPSLSVYPTAFPNGSAISHTSYNSSLTGFGGKTITAGQNFYCNGVDLAPGSQWNLILKDNDNAKDSFAEAHNATIADCKATAHSGTYAWLAASEGCFDKTSAAQQASCTNVAFSHPVILKDSGRGDTAEGTSVPETPNRSGTYTVRDDVIRIEFIRHDANQNMPFDTDSLKIENSNNEISAALANIKFDNGTKAFTGAYTDAECRYTTDGKGDLYVIYLKASETWNLDATGTNAQPKPESQDSHAVRKNVLPDIYLERALDTVFAVLTDEHKNRIGNYSNTPSTTPSYQEGFIFTATTSRCANGQMYITTTLAQIGSNKVYVYFDQPLSPDITWKDPTFPTLQAIKLYSNPGVAHATLAATDIQLNTLSPNGIILILNQDLTFDDLHTLGIGVDYPGTYLRKNRIMSADDKFIVYQGETHCITDFALNMIQVQYAYDGRNETYSQTMGITQSSDAIAIHDFSGSKDGRVFEDKDIHLVAKNISGINSANIDFTLIADISPTPGSSATAYNKYAGKKCRAWLPNNFITNCIPNPNNSANIRRSDTSPNLIEPTKDAATDSFKYLFHNDSRFTDCLKWPSGSEVQFIYEVTDSSGGQYIINHNYTNDASANKTPFYALRLDNPSDLSTIDLWSFKITEPSRQRGGVSIYNNVVNVTNGGFCTLEINMPRAGNLRVIVMTLDGGIVKYLESGRTSEGLHYYYWHGKNKSNNPVARGIYFVRIVGPDIDETRKIMVVK